MEQHVPRDDKFRVAIATRRIRRKRIVARHVRMNDFDPVSPDEFGHLVRAWNVERVAQRQRLDPVAVDFQVSDQRRMWPQDGVEVVTSRDQRVCEIRNVTLTAAKGCR